MKGKKTAKAIAFTVLGILLAVLVCLGIRYRNTVKLVFNWDNIVSLVNSVRYDRDTIETRMDENKKEMEKLAEEDPNISIRGDLTAEEAQALKDGIITKEQAISIVKGDTTLEEILAQKDTPDDKPDQSSGKDTTPPKEVSAKPAGENPPQTEEKKDRASEIIAELYVLQADFISRLEQLGNRAYEDYKAQNYDRSKVMSIVDSYTGEVNTLERDCDNKVKVLLAELEAELTSVGGDLSVVKEIRKYYYKEKSLKKAYYLNKLNDEDYK